MVSQLRGLERWRRGKEEQWTDEKGQNGKRENGFLFFLGGGGREALVCRKDERLE
jgi:hypothetical protein